MAVDKIHGVLLRNKDNHYVSICIDINSLLSYFTDCSIYLRKGGCLTSLSVVDELDGLFLRLRDYLEQDRKNWKDYVQHCVDFERISVGVYYVGDNIYIRALDIVIYIEQSIFGLELTRRNIKVSNDIITDMTHAFEGIRSDILIFCRSMEVSTDVTN